MRYKALAVSLLFLMALCACTTFDRGEREAELSPEPAPGEAELLEYGGRKLTPISKQRSTVIKGTQDIDISAYRLDVTGLVEKPLSLTYNEVLSYSVVNEVHDFECVEGWGFTAMWSGPKVGDILNDAGVKESAKWVIFQSADGYSTALPLDYIMGEDVIIAHRLNNVTLPADRGFPFQTVAKGKYGYKWAKWVIGIELSDTEYEGFWEMRGYNNEADIGGPKRDT